MLKLFTTWRTQLLFIGFFGLCLNLFYLAVPIYFMVVFDKVLFSFSRSTLYTLALGVLLSLAAAMLLDYLRARLLGQVGNAMARRLFPAVFGDMQRRAAGFEQHYRRGMDDLDLVRKNIADGRLFYVLDIPWVLIYLVVLYLIHPFIGFVALGVVVLALLFHLLLRKVVYRRHTIADVAFAGATDFSDACTSHAEIIAGNGMLPAARRTFHDDYSRVLDARSAAHDFEAGTGALLRFLYSGGVALLFTIGAFVFFTDQISTGLIIAVVMIIARIFVPLQHSLSAMRDSIEAVAAWRRLQSFVDTAPVPDKLALPEPRGGLTAESLSLSQGGKLLLHNISFDLQPGESLAIIGPSGSGKSVLCRTLLGIWPASGGKVRLDGAEISQWPPEQFGAAVGYVPDEPRLFATDVAHNIAGLQEPDGDKVIEAAQKCGVHASVLALGQGYDTRLEHDGKNLPSGQRQLLSLARAVYDDPGVVVFDEPQTHLDDGGLRLLSTLLATLKTDKTTIVVVTDRTNIIRNMDKILLLGEGKTVMYGAAAEVLQKLAARQQSGNPGGESQ